PLSVWSFCFLLFFHVFVLHRHPHSFPTRRSSDLTALAVDQGQLSLMRLYDRGTKGQTEAKAMGLCGVERFEQPAVFLGTDAVPPDRKSTRLNSSHDQISYAVFCLKKKSKDQPADP